MSTDNGNVMQITKRAADVHQDQENGERGDDRFVRQDFGERVNRAVESGGCGRKTARCARPPGSPAWISLDLLLDSPA